MYLGQTQKQVGEKRRVLVNYAPWLGDVERLAENTGELFIQRLDGRAMVVGLDLEPDGPYILNEKTAQAVYLSGGVDGVDYKLTVRGETNQGQIREDEILIQVREV